MQKLSAAFIIYSPITSNLAWPNQVPESPSLSLLLCSKWSFWSRAVAPSNRIESLIGSEFGRRSCCAGRWDAAGCRGPPYRPPIQGAGIFSDSPPARRPRPYGHTREARVAVASIIAAIEQRTRSTVEAIAAVVLEVRDSCAIASFLGLHLKLRLEIGHSET